MNLLRALVMSGFFAAAIQNSAAADTPAIPANGAALPALPSLALDPHANFWSGLSVGTTVFTSFQKGSKPLVGGAGTLSLTKKLDPQWSIGVSASTGFAPYSFRSAPLKGFNFATADVKLSYDMGQIKPWVSAGGIVTRPTAYNSGTNASDSLNALFGSGGRGAGTFGAGVDVQLTNNLTLGVGVHVGNGVAPLMSGFGASMP